MEDYQGKHTGKQIDDAIDNVAKLMAKNFPLEASVSGGGTYEKGSSVTPSATFNVTREGASVVDSATISVSPSAIIDKTNKQWTANSAVSSNTTFTTTFTQGGQTVTKTNAWNFSLKKYYGVSAKTTLTSEDVLALGKSDWASKTMSAKTFDCSGGKYPYYCIPASLGTPEFWVGGLKNSNVTSIPLSVTNASGYTETYNIFRLTDMQYGSDISIEFK